MSLIRSSVIIFLPSILELNHRISYLIVHIISRKKLNEFAEKYPDSKSALIQWYRIIKQGYFDSIADIRQVFPTADKVGKLTVFNIGGNKFRLITAIHYNRQKIYIRAVLTHKEYDQGKWKE